MKWFLTSIVLVFGCLSLASSVPLILDDTAIVYPAYPGVPANYVNLDFGKFFRQAANSVKNLYGFVNEWIFGKNKDPNSVGYKFWKKYHDNASSAQPPIDPNGVHIEAYKVFKDANGRVVVKNIPNIANLKIPLFPQKLFNKIPMSENDFNKIESMNIPGLIGPIVLDENLNAIGNENKEAKKDSPEGKINLNSLIMKNPFRWNEKLGKIPMFREAGDEMMIRPVLIRIEGEMLPGGLDKPINELLNNKDLQKIIAEQIQAEQNSQPHETQAPNQPQTDKPHEEKPQSTEGPTNAPNQPAAESDKQSEVKNEAANETPAAEEKPQNDDYKESDDEENDAKEPDSDQTQATEIPKKETSTQQKKQHGGDEKVNSDNQAPNAASDVPPQQSSTQGKKIYIRVGNEDVSLDTARKVLEMVQAKGKN